jgi:uncharacterized phage-associated protein
MFNEQKAAQIAAWFLSQEGGVMPHLKLMKLMYLCERESMKRCGFPMTGDSFVSMKHGPVLSNTLNCINGYSQSSPESGWDSWISDKADNKVALVNAFDAHRLDELSRADMAVLTDVWSQFGRMTKYQLVDYTHDPKNCPEWRNPGNSVLPIHYRSVFLAMGYSRDQAVEMATEIDAQSAAEAALA